MHVRESYRAYRDRIQDLHLRLEVEGVTLHSGRNLIKAVTVTEAGGGSIELAVKAFGVPARPRGFIYARIRPSKAWRSMAHAERLMGLGIATPEPVACIECEDAGCLRESYYICRYWPHEINLTSLLYGGGTVGERTRPLLEQLARFTFLQHERGVLHRDYNPGNILARERGTEFDFALVDLNRVRFDTLDENERISGIVRLTTSVEYLHTIGCQYAALYGVDSTRFCRRLEEAFLRFQVRRRAVKRLKSWIKNED